MEEDINSTLEWTVGHLDELVAYTQTPEFHKLPAADQDLIVQQASVVNTLKDILTIRVERAK